MSACYSTSKTHVGKSSDIAQFSLVVDTSRSDYNTTSRYLSLAMSAHRLIGDVKGFDFSSQKLKNMAAALAPANIRFGGTPADTLLFEEQTGGERSSSALQRSSSKYTMRGAEWGKITKFCDDAGWDIMWDFNLFHWKDRKWDPSYAREFLEYSASRGVRIPAFQLGNEPDLYRGKYNIFIGGDILADGFQRLKNLTAEFPLYKNSGLYGPDVTNLQRSNAARKYLGSFLRFGGCDVVDEVAVHHYYLKGQYAQLTEFLDPGVMNSLMTLLTYTHAIIQRECDVYKPIRLSETSSASSGGRRGLSDAFAAGFLWLDKLGLAAKYGVTSVFRQTFFGSNYALVTHRLDPNPDYFLSVLYKRLIEGPVFNVDTTNIPPSLRLYSHCARKGYYNYPDGALVVYYLNTANSLTHLSLGQYKNSAVELFALTPGNGLRSREIKLNGELLAMEGSTLPRMKPKTHSHGAVPLAPQSYGFIVIPNADVELCKKYHQSAKHNTPVTE